MFVASRVESGDEGQAVAGPFPQVIGHIEKVVGCGTLSRASGIDVRAKVGDPVCQGDAIETSADGRIGIRFIDGTLLHLSHSTRAVLNEFVCDSVGISHSALFEVTTGTFAFIAGDVAKTGCLRVDTPFGTIRGRARSGGIGMLSLVALTFAVMKEVQASDPDVTFLDDGSITYKNLEHGSFELVTKEAVPRHILVEDPGETIVLRAQGSSISVNQVANTAARMGELQDAQQDVLANLAKGLGPTGSSTPPSVDALPLQPINFIQTDSSPPEQESLPPLPSIVNAVFEIIVASPQEPPPPPPPSPPTLTAVAGPTEIDTVAFDEFAATSGTFAASSSNSGATLTFGISDADLGNPVLGEATFDVSKTGSYGTLYLNSATGAYTFVPDNAAINALTAPTTETFVITVSDGTLSASQTFTITINGTNDAAIVSGAATGSVIEPGDAMSTVTGTLTATDVDNPPNTFTAVSSPTASDAGYGTFTMTATGTWTYTLNDANDAVQALNVGGRLTDTFTVSTEDGTPQVVTISIEGTNDAAIISGATTGSVVESGRHKCGAPTVTGTLTATDVDNPPDSFTAVNSSTASDAGYGTFTMTADGTWTYTLDDDNCAVQALNVGGTLTDTFTVTTEDGTAQIVTISIEGTNDAAIISGKTTGSVVEEGHHKCGTPTATGKLTAADVDNAPNSFTAVSTPTESDSGYGTFTMTATGKWTYTLDDDNCAVQALNVGGTLTDTFTVTTEDGTPQVVTITIEGANDHHHHHHYHHQHHHHHHHRDNFDWLAAGSNEKSDLPYVYGGPEGDTIAGGSDQGQPIGASADNFSFVPDQADGAVVVHVPHDLVV